MIPVALLMFFNLKKKLRFCLEKLIFCLHLKTVCKSYLNIFCWPNWTTVQVVPEYMGRTAQIAVWALQVGGSKISWKLEKSGGKWNNKIIHILLFTLLLETLSFDQLINSFRRLESRKANFLFDCNFIICNFMREKLNKIKWTIFFSNLGKGIFCPGRYFTLIRH